MPRTPHCAIVLGMTDAATHAQIKLRIERAAEPIAGTLEDHCGNSRPFLGWMELISAVEDARRAPVPYPALANSAERLRGGM